MNVGLIGLGMVAGTFADACAASDVVELTCAFSPTKTRRDEFVAAHGNQIEAVTSLQEMLNRKLDFVMLATPPNARSEIIDACINARVPVLMEKPVERTLDAAKALVTACEDAALPLGIMLQHRTRPMVAKLRALMPRFGALHMIEVTVPWWRDQAYYDAPGRGSYARDGGGVLISQAIHTLDLMLHLTGPVSEVTAMIGTARQHQMEAENFATAGLRFENGALGQMFATTASYPGRGERIVMHFENGSVQLEAGTLAITWRNGEAQTLGEQARSGAGANPMDFGPDAHRAVIEDFAQSLQESRPPLITGRSALRVHALIDAIENSSKQGRRVPLDV